MNKDDYMRKVASAWKELPEAKRNVYNEAHKAESVKYRQELEKWEKEMVSIGNIDLIRKQALIVQDDGPKRKRASRAKAAKSDWSDGWCSDSPDDKQEKNESINHLPDDPRQVDLESESKILSSKTIESEEGEQKQASSNSEKDTTGDRNQPLSTEKPSSEAKNKPADNSKENVIKKFKDFFKF